MFENLNFWEIGALLLLALFIFGPERLPKVIGDGMRMIRNLRDMARNATGDLSRELGTEVRIEDLHPKTFIRKHLLSEEDEAALRRPFDDAYGNLRDISGNLGGGQSGPSGQGGSVNGSANGAINGSGGTSPTPPAQRGETRSTFDTEAT